MFSCLRRETPATYKIPSMRMPTVKRMSLVDCWELLLTCATAKGVPETTAELNTLPSLTICRVSSGLVHPFVRIETFFVWRSGVLAEARLYCSLAHKTPLSPRIARASTTSAARDNGVPCTLPSSRVGDSSQNKSGDA